MNLYRTCIGIGLGLASLLAVGCSGSETPNAAAPPPAATSSGSTASGAPTAPAVAATVAPNGDPLPGLAEWKGKKNPTPTDAQTLAAAKELFIKNCAPCHGNEGKGDGPAGIALDPKPRDFTSGQFQFGSEDWQLFRTAWEGIPGTGMAPWKGRMTDKETWTVLRYVRSLTGKP